MNNIKLALFLSQKAELEWNGDKLICWINIDDLREFTHIVGCNYLCEGGIPVNLQENQIAFEINDLLEYAEIEQTDLREKPEN